tara:strand:+ start:461 stop:1042 length:582 start_codon:yes stop_codon:yes gene_type:complete
MNNTFVNILSEKNYFIDLNDNMASEYILLIETVKFLNELYNSFKNIDDRFNQFHKDFIRSNIYINNIRIINFKKFLKKFDNSSLNKISLICTQATFAYPYMLLVNSIKDQKGMEGQNLYIGEIANSDKTNHINSKLKMLISKEDKIVKKVILKKFLRAFYINNHGCASTYKIIYIKFIFNININEIYLKFKIL